MPLSGRHSAARNPIGGDYSQYDVRISGVVTRNGMTSRNLNW